MNKQHNFRQMVNRRLSTLRWTKGMEGAVLSQLEGENKMKRKLSASVLVIALLLVLFAGVTLAVGTKVFDLFASGDPALQFAAEHGKPATTMVSHEAGDVDVEVEDIFFDGTNMYLSYRARDCYRNYQAYQPTDEEIDAFIKIDAPGAVPDGVGKWLEKTVPEEYAQILQCYKNSQPYGFTYQKVMLSYEMETDDGISLVAYRGTGFVIENEHQGFMAMESPLPEALRDRESITLHMNAKLLEWVLYYDGENLYGSVRKNEPPYQVIVHADRSDVPMEELTVEATATLWGITVQGTLVISPANIRFTGVFNEDQFPWAFDHPTEKRFGSQVPQYVMKHPQYDEWVYPYSSRQDYARYTIDLNGLGYIPDSISFYPVMQDEETQRTSTPNVDEESPITFHITNSGE